MFSFLKPDPVKKLRKSYDLILEQAMQAQRKGDIKTYSLLTAESEQVWAKIAALEAAKKRSFVLLTRRNAVSGTKIGLIVVNILSRCN